MSFKKYFKHLIGNWYVALKAVGLVIFHFMHEIVPVKYTSHNYWGLRLTEGVKQN